LCLRFARNVNAYRRGLAGGGWHIKSFWSCCCCCCCCCRSKPMPITPRRLTHRVRYFTHRFAPHAPRWQWVIWARQLALVAAGAAALPLQRTHTTFVSVAILVVAVAIPIILIAWFFHRRHQPYAYRFQNAIEAFLLASTVVLLLLAVIYSALSQEFEAGSAALTVCEVALMAVLLGSLLVAAVVVVHDALSSRRRLKNIDLTAVLATAEKRFDGVIAERLRDGTIRLLCCDWLASSASDAFLGRDPTTGRPIILRRQDMPAEAYFSPEEAAALFSRGDRSVLVLSYGWHTCPHSDPHGLTLAKVRHYLRGDPSTSGCAMFWDIASRPQPEQTDEEDAIGRKALECMSMFYASVTGTTVLIQREVPPRPSAYDGKIRLFGVAKDLFDETRLRADLSRFGTVASCEICPALVELEAGLGRSIAKVKAAHADVAFATHAEAEAALVGLAQQRRGAALFYNATPYDDKGWCLVEKGSSGVVAAHLAKAAKHATGLPERYQRAEAARAKLIDITGCATLDAKPEVLELSEEPTVVLKQTMCALAACRFTFPSDRTMAEEMMADFEWTINSAMEQAELAQNAHVLSIDPKLLRSKSRNLSVTVDSAPRDPEVAAPVQGSIASRNRKKLPHQPPASYPAMTASSTTDNVESSPQVMVEHLATFDARRLGLGISSARLSGVAAASCDSDVGVVVSSVDDDSAASAQSVNVGDVVIEVSGQSTRGLSKDEVLSMIAAASRPLTLLLRQQSNMAKSSAGMDAASTGPIGPTEAR